MKYKYNKLNKRYCDVCQKETAFKETVELDELDCFTFTLECCKCQCDYHYFAPWYDLFEMLFNRMENC